jgi:hypothetical protein
VTELLRAGGALAALVVVVGIVSVVVAGRDARLVDIQLGTDVGKVTTLIDNADRGRAVRRGIAVDWFFIAAYVATFVFLGVVLLRRGGAWSGAVAIATAVAAGVLDVLENVRTLGVLRHAGSGCLLSQHTLDALRQASLAKWGACATTVGLLAGVFLVRGWPAAIGIALIAIALIGLCGLHWHGLIPVYFLFAFFATIAIAVILLAWPASLASRY